MRFVVIFAVLGQLLCVALAEARVIRSSGPSGSGPSARAALWQAVLEVAGPSVGERSNHPTIYLGEGSVDGQLDDPPEGVIAASGFSNMLRPISEYGDKLRMSAQALFVCLEFVALDRAKMRFGTQTAGGCSELVGNATWSDGEWTLRLDDVVVISCGIFGITWALED